MLRPPVYDVDRAGEYLIPYAKRRLIALENQRRANGCPFLRARVYDEGGATVDLEAGHLVHRIRIRAGSPPRHVIAGHAGGGMAVYVTDINGRLVTRAFVEGDFHPLYAGISADAGTQYVVSTYPLPAPDTTSGITRLYLHIFSNGSLSAEHFVDLTPPVGWTVKVIDRTDEFGILDDVHRPQALAISEGKVLSLGAYYVDPVPHGVFVGHRDFKFTVLYFDGETLSLQESAWASSAGPSVGIPAFPGFSEDAQAHISFAEDCSAWAMVLNTYGREDTSAGVWAERHTTETGDVDVFRYGLGFNNGPGFVSEVLSDVYGFIAGSDNKLITGHREVVDPGVTVSSVKYTLNGSATIYSKSLTGIVTNSTLRGFEKASPNGNVFMFNDLEPAAAVSTKVYNHGAIEDFTGVLSSRHLSDAVTPAVYIANDASQSLSIAVEGDVFALTSAPRSLTDFDPLVYNNGTVISFGEPQNLAGVLSFRKWTPDRDEDDALTGFTEGEIRLINNSELTESQSAELAEMAANTPNSNVPPWDSAFRRGASLS